MFLPLTTGDKLRRPPILIGVIIALCVVVFLLPHAHPKASTDLLGHAVREDTGQAFVSFDHPLHLFTYTFLHGSLSHLLGNMFFLWTFGRLLEARWGRLLTALCFVVAGAAGAALHAVATTRHGVPLIGASGAISGLAGAVVVALPNARFNRIFSPLLWPVTPIVALARGRGFAALLELLPFYGWILKLPRGLPATFVLPAWLSLDMFSMMAEPGSHTSYACHVGGAFAGIGFAIVVRATDLPEHLARLLGLTTEDSAPRASDPALAPAIRSRRDADRPSQFPTGRFAGGWFVLSLLGAVALMVGTTYASERLRDWAQARNMRRSRDKLLATPSLAEAPLDARYDASLVSISYPGSFWACGAGRSAAGPCAEVKLPNHPNVTYVELVRPEALESVEVMAIRGGVDQRSEMVDAVLSEIASRAASAREPWALVETHNGTCRGAYSVESVIEIGSGDNRLRMWACSFNIGRDVFLFASLMPASLVERDQPTLDRIFRELQLPAEAAPVAAAAPSPDPPPPLGLDGADDGHCRPDQTSYRVGGKVRCADSVARPPPRPATPPPARTIRRR